MSKINILMIGDICGFSGRMAIKKYLPEIIKKKKIDLVIANGENVSHGKSLIYKHYLELKNTKIDVITSGNHIFKKAEVLQYINDVPDLLRPLNFSSFVPGKGTTVVNVKSCSVRITNLIGRTFMEHYDNPYQIFDELLLTASEDIHLVDFHAEATAEKLAFAWNYDGKITALVGTHTHVQTADNRLLPNKTAYISDLGMCGSYNSIIGVEPQEVIYHEKTGLPTIFVPSNDKTNLIFSGVVITINEVTKQAEHIERILITPDNSTFLKDININDN